MWGGSNALTDLADGQKAPSIVLRQHLHCCQRLPTTLADHFGLRIILSPFGT
jgi:hypothetical protein